MSYARIVGADFTPLRPPVGEHPLRFVAPPLQTRTRLRLGFAFGKRLGASGRNRTNDTRIFSPLLYRLSYRGEYRTVNSEHGTVNN